MPTPIEEYLGNDEDALVKGPRKRIPLSEADREKFRARLEQEETPPEIEETHQLMARIPVHLNRWLETANHHRGTTKRQELEIALTKHLKEVWPAGPDPLQPPEEESNEQS